MNTIALFYNKKVLAEAGVTPPKTWDELQSAAAKLTKGDQYGFAVDANATYEGTWQFLPFMWSNGGDEKDIATPETAEALQLWKTWSTTARCRRASSTGPRPTSTTSSWPARPR